MYKVYGTFIFVPGLDLSTSGLDPNTAMYSLSVKSLLKCRSTLATQGIVLKQNILCVLCNVYLAHDLIVKKKIEWGHWYVTNNTNVNDRCHFKGVINYKL